MKNKKKIVLSLCCACLLVFASVMGTIAYLTSKDAVVNTFTVGKVAIELDEAAVNPDGTYVKDKDTRVKQNDYHLLPGHEYIKDPTVTVNAGSDASYVRMLVKVSDMNALKSAFPEAKYPGFYQGDLFLLQKLVTGWDAAKWQSVGLNAAGEYEFRYYETVSAIGNGTEGTNTAVELEPLFETIVIPGTVNNTELAHLQGINITVTAHAIQADGFNTADQAWAAFDDQSSAESN